MSNICFVWDESKERANKAKHGIGFSLAQEVFDDPNHTTIIDDRFDYGETRYRTVGLIDGILVLVVTHTSNDDDSGIRIISARKATKEERRRYEQRR